MLHNLDRKNNHPTSQGRFAGVLGVTISSRTTQHSPREPQVMIELPKEKDSVAPYSLAALVKETVVAFLDAHTHIDEVNGLHAKVMGEVEKTLIEIVLQKVSGNQIKTSHVLGINRNTLYAKIKNYGLCIKSKK